MERSRASYNPRRTVGKPAQPASRLAARVTAPPSQTPASAAAAVKGTRRAASLFLNRPPHTSPGLPPEVFPHSPVVTYFKLGQPSIWHIPRAFLVHCLDVRLHLRAYRAFVERSRSRFPLTPLSLIQARVPPQPWLPSLTGRRPASRCSSCMLPSQLVAYVCIRLVYELTRVPLKRYRQLPVS